MNQLSLSKIAVLDVDGSEVLIAVDNVSHIVNDKRGNLSIYLKSGDVVLFRVKNEEHKKQYEALKNLFFNLNAYTYPASFPSVWPAVPTVFGQQSIPPYQQKFTNVDIYD